MTGAAGEVSTTDEASEPIDTSISRPDTFAARAQDSASKARERIANQFEPGETKSTTRRLSDTPGSMRNQSGSNEAGERKSVLEATHELVAKALGSGSRGGFAAGFAFALADTVNRFELGMGNVQSYSTNVSGFGYSIQYCLTALRFK
ncbi:hypothetical protein N7492_003207 [Penicillium capsulatum]|uniref:Uncharacterized protein n=1 Tax=Penicillium capsulatum TaxID=69766 RepID=A0A9W9ILJ3_9EURO|nr:hypothetical protein N7492_003207 [Penicillium capsulatum]KAJ6122206.1 hypothetical protein N7512_004671 [Penicillium capsulatum]